MIVRIPRFLCVLYHARSSHQSLRTSTVCITALSKEKAEDFACFLFIVVIVAVIELFYDEFKTIFVEFTNFVCSCSELESQSRFQHLTNAFGGMGTRGID